MNSGYTSERVYGALKARLLAGEFKPGERLDPAQLSETLASSVTPVRDVLNILRGEGLIETRTGEGFFRPHVTAPDLEDLYDWAEQILLLAIRHWPKPAAPALLSDAPASARMLFEAVCARSTNAEYRRAILGLNDRLEAARMVEPLVLADVEPELEALRTALAQANGNEAARIVTGYHRRRRRQASDIVRAVYRSAGSMDA